ncbi:MAG: hypothetical protein Q9193_002072 [Seirophora villosa]
MDMARDILPASPAELGELRQRWADRSVQVWGPFATPGSPEAFIPMRRQITRLLLTASTDADVLHAVPREYYPSVEEISDDDDDLVPQPGPSHRSASDAATLSNKTTPRPKKDS